MVKEKCWDCGGSGKKDYYINVDNGVCYTCCGTGVWHERIRLTPSQEKRREYAQSVRDKKLLAALLKELEVARKELEPLAHKLTWEYATRAIPVPKALDEAVTAACAKIKRITIEGWEVQKRVTDVEYTDFKDAHMKYEELRGL